MTPTEVPMSHASPKPVSGVTLEQLAGVTAAVMEGFALADALANDGIANTAWSRASVGWNQRLASVGGEAPLSLQFRALLGQAQDWLGGRLLPVDDDPAAWLDLLAALGSSPDPTPLLGQLGIKAREVARSQRRWAERMGDDEDIRKHVAALAHEQRNPVPAITVVAPQLKPFPWTCVLASPRRAVGVAESGGTKDAGLALDQYAALKAELTVRPADRERILVGYGLDEEGLGRVELAWSERFAVEPAAARDFRLLESLSEVRFRAAVGGDGLAGESASQRPSASWPTVQALASAAGDGARETEASKPLRRVATASPLGATGEISWAALGVAPLPFGKTRPAARLEREGSAGVAATTIRGGKDPSAEEAASRGPAVGVGETAELTPEMLAVVLRRVRAPRFLAGATESADGGTEPDDRGASFETWRPAQEQRTPATSSGPVSDPGAPGRRHAAAEPQVERAKASRPAATVDVAHAAIGAAPLPFASGRMPAVGVPASGAPAVAAAAMFEDGSPSRGETKEVSVTDLRAGSAAVPFGVAAASKRAPELTLEQYASYAAEMVATPSEYARILKAYGIASHAARVALSVHWGERFEAEPELKARFEWLQQQYVAWLRAKRGELK